MSKKTRLLAIICAFAGSMILFGCSDSSTISIEGDHGSEGTKPVDETCDPGDENCQPAEETCKPGDENCQPAEETCKPGDENCQPAEETCKPGDENCQPAEETCKPGDENCDPGEETGPVEVEPCSASDEDGDFISDEIEGRNKEDDSLSRDTDGDTVPDYKDLDSDGDTIPDSIEGGINCSGDDPENRGYGVFDYINADVDENGISDAIECCGADESKGEECAADVSKDENGFFVTCHDSNGDGTPDYISDDNDGDGANDIREIEGMSSGSEKIGSTQFSGDCDGDTIPDEIGSAENPIDCDKDGIPDYMDVDSDGDTILDSVEKDSIHGDYFARYSKDSDGDGIPDGEECRGNKIEINGVEYFSDCIDSDKDGTPDYLDLDSDSDGILDSIEKQIGSNPVLQDSDGDGAPDAVEYGICLVNKDTKCSAITDKNDSPQTRGDFVFVAPYKEPTDPPRQTLSLETAIQTVDIFFNFDQSGSMSKEVKSLKDSLKSMLENLQCKDLGKKCSENNDCKEFPNAICSEKGKCITSPSYGNGCFDRMWTGLGFYSYADSFRVTNHLSEGYKTTLTSLTNCFDGTSFKSAGNNEVPYQAAICAAVGPDKDKSLCAQRANYTNDCSLNASAYRECKMNCSTDKKKEGCVGYRKDAIHIYVQAFDENQCKNNGGEYAKTYCENYKKQVGTIMKQYKMRFIGLYSNENTDTNDGEISNQTVAEDIAKKSGSLDNKSKPFTYLAMDDKLAEKAATAVREIAKNMPVDITATVEDIDAGAKDLVAGLEVNLTGTTAQNRVCTIITNEIVKDKYEGVKGLMPGQVLCYDVIAVQNQSIFKPDKTEPKVYKARIKVMGDGSVLNSGIAYFLVPPVFEQGEEIN